MRLAVREFKATYHLPIDQLALYQKRTLSDALSQPLIGAGCDEKQNNWQITVYNLAKCYRHGRIMTI